MFQGYYAVGVANVFPCEIIKRPKETIWNFFIKIDFSLYFFNIRPPRNEPNIEEICP